MLYSVMFFGALGVVPLIHRAYEVAGDTSDPFESYVSVCLGSSALRTHIIDYAGISAARVTVYRMVYRTVADTVLLHASDDLLESVQVLHRVSVEFDIGDVSAVCQSVIRSFEPDLLKCVYRIIYGNME